MKRIHLTNIIGHFKSKPESESIQSVKAHLTGQPITTVIDCNAVIVDEKELNKLIEYKAYYEKMFKDGNIGGIINTKT